MEIRQLSYFVKAAELLHFTEAAAAVYITQSTLSQQIKLLEQELGLPLFDRLGKQVRLTEAGKVFLTHARRILLNVEKGKQAIADLNNLVTGELRIGVTYAFTSLILPVLPVFTKRYPSVKINLEYGAPEILENKLKQSELDLILAFHNQNNDPDFDLQPLSKSDIVMVVSKKNPLAKLGSISLKDILSRNLILPAKGFSSRNFVDELFEQRKIKPAIKIEMNDMHSLLSLVQNSDEISIINEKALIGWEKLAAIPISGRKLTRQSYIIWHKGAYRNKAAVIFAEELLKVSNKV
ncbi:LysR substrate-binding domain-containing protein [Mucilaginibacter sp. KACC 22063]|uniref:LysR substrate-binding domain-containing protein n=1 Tax=Mucilaginibacter sp. KACC 22063 TaxID=3025666 RepID=UPI002366C832|nr:LysR substrate-binding domain-containing protein [Mucilaginibacter sp. KACC 22063]WDF53478.1 LysR substrate-binding domain-containing protein [Mucilaginibacter sp. KACC 22063]